MASYTPSGKRRRLEHASTAISKPFKSPLRRETPTVKKEVASQKPDEKVASTSSTPTVKTSPAVGKATQNPPSTSFSYNSFATPPPSNKRTINGQRLTTARRSVLSDPEILDLQKQQRVLHLRLATLRSELDTVQQALQIESSNKDNELESLILKWKKVSQDAAEEVFSGTQERISRMGGVKVWRERMRSTDVRWEQEEMESWFGNVDAEGVDMDKDELEARKGELMDEIEKKDGEERAHEDDELQGFTMDMMLKTLNIDFKFIGYDKLNQKWVNG